MNKLLDNPKERVVEDLARRIAAEAPDLGDLNAEELEAVARAVVGKRLVRDMDRRVDLAGIDPAAEREAYLRRSKSVHTRRAYAAALARLETYAERLGSSVFDLSPKNVDDWIVDMSAEGRAPASVRRDTAAASAWFTWLERRHETIRNPFRGTRARPAKKRARALAIPTEREIEAIMADCPPKDRAAVAIMVYRGLRVGALPTLSIRDGRFTAESKGKTISGDLPAAVLTTIRRAGLSLRRPFAEDTGKRIAERIWTRSRRLARDGHIAAAYSVHDFRHFYALTEYRRDPDIYRLSRLLGHAGIAVTEHYLRGIGEID